MTFLSLPALRCGGPQNLPHSTLLHAGPVSALLEQGELRQIMLGNIELVRRFYVGLRGPDWAAIPNIISDLKIQATDQDFLVTYVVQNKHADFDFIWKILIVGTALGQIQFHAEGKAHGNFKYNRASICVLHPLRECIGKKVAWLDSHGMKHHGQFPETINPHQPFLNTQSIEYQIQTGLNLSLKYTGDEFEMEDQRNWSDGSFKTYSPPQARPKPFLATPEWETKQSVTLDLVGTVAAINLPVKIGTINVDDSICNPLPRLGFGVSSDHRPAIAADILSLKKLSPQHLRVNIRLASAQYPADLSFAVAESLAMDVPLEVALVITDGEADKEKLELYLSDFVLQWNTSGAKAVRWMLFSETRDAITEETFFTVKNRLELGLSTLDLSNKFSSPDTVAQFVIGSKSDFVLLNRNRPEQILASDTEDQLGLAFGLTPQVHLTDNRTLVESLEGQFWNLRTAASHWPNKKIFVTPITLKRSPFVQAIKKPAASYGLDQWKSQVDARQFSLFAAAWTLGSLKSISLGKPSGSLDVGSTVTATYFETHGLLGLLAGEAAGDLKVPGTDFEIKKGWVFPLYHIFADFAEFVGGTVGEVTSDASIYLKALKLSIKNKNVILIANLDSNSVKVDLHSVGNFSTVRRLNELTAQEAMEKPELYRTKSYPIDPNALHEFVLLPFEVLRVNLH